MPALGGDVRPAEVKKRAHLRVALPSACPLAIGLGVYAVLLAVGWRLGSVALLARS